MSRRRHFEHSEVTNCNCIFGIFNMVGSIAGAAINKSAVDNTNKMNQAQFDQTFDYTKERDRISDERYADELAYDRALQERIFEREDTAYQRTADDMSAAGINPLSMQGTNQAGQQVTSPQQPSSAGAPAPGTNQPYHVDFGNLEPSLSFLNDLQNLYTGGIQRDKLRAEQNSIQLDNQTKALDNLIKANQNGVMFDDDGNPYLTKDFVLNQDKSQVDYDTAVEGRRNAHATANRNEREDFYQANTGLTDNTPSEIRTATAVTDLLEDTATNFLKGERTGDSSSTTFQDRVMQTKNGKLRGVFNFLTNAANLGVYAFGKTPLGNAIKSRNKVVREGNESMKKRSRSASSGRDR